MRRVFAHGMGLSRVDATVLAAAGAAADDCLEEAQVHSLNLANNELASSESLAGLPAFASLASLNLSDNAITHIVHLDSLRHLSELRMANCRLQSLHGLEGLPLRELDVSGNAIASLAPLAANRELRGLNVARNLVSSLRGVEDLPLLSLDASHNRLVDLTEVFALSRGGAQQLKSLALAGNELAAICAFRDAVLRALPELLLLDGDRVPQFGAARKAFRDACSCGGVCQSSSRSPGKSQSKSLSLTMTGWGEEAAPEEQPEPEAESEVVPRPLTPSHKPLKSPARPGSAPVPPPEAARSPMPRPQSAAINAGYEEPADPAEPVFRQETPASAQRLAELARPRTAGVRIQRVPRGAVGALRTTVAAPPAPSNSAVPARRALVRSPFKHTVRPRTAAAARRQRRRAAAARTSPQLARSMSVGSGGLSETSRRAGGAARPGLRPQTAGPLARGSGSGSGSPSPETLRFVSAAPRLMAMPLPDSPLPGQESQRLADLRARLRASASASAPALDPVVVAVGGAGGVRKLQKQQREQRRSVRRHGSSGRLIASDRIRETPGSVTAATDPTQLVRLAKAARRPSRISTVRRPRWVTSVDVHQEVAQLRAEHLAEMQAAQEEEAIKKKIAQRRSFLVQQGFVAD